MVDGRCFVLVLIVMLKGMCCEAESSHVQPSDLSRIAIIIRSQNNPYHIHLAKALKKNILAQVNGASNNIPLIELLHERWPIHGAWTLFPIFPDLAKNEMDFGSTDWFIFCEDQTTVNLYGLFEVVSRYDPEKYHFLGKALYDTDASIIHHFAFIEDPSQFPFPDFAAGFIISKPLIKRIAEKYEKTRMEMDFSIDAQHEIAKYIYDHVNEMKLKNIDEFCSGDKEGMCVTTYPKELRTCKNNIKDGDIFFAIKTCEKHHKDRVSFVKQSWGAQARHKEYYSDKEDESIPTVDLGVPNTESGHCGKLEAILKRAANNENIQNRKWLVVVDDDTILSVSRLKKLLSCYDADEMVAIGERYGYGTSSGMGYDYPTGGSGMILSLKLVKHLVASGEASCPSIESPDDMMLGSWLKSQNIVVVHSPLLHQARPDDYSLGYLAHQVPVTFHKHWMLDPRDVYNTWFKMDDVDVDHDEL